MKSFRELTCSEKGKIACIICAGGTMSKHGRDIRDSVYVKAGNIFTIGVNNIHQLLTPDYHLWTNTGRLREFGNNISPDSTVMFGDHIKENMIKKIYSGEYIVVEYTDKNDEDISYENGKIRGYYRTAGCLAIMIAHLLGAKDILVAGMDGYTLYEEGGSGGQHFYGSGMTDGNSREVCRDKDIKVNRVLHSLKRVGIDFSIVTPTVFKDFYSESKAILLRA